MGVVVRICDDPPWKATTAVTLEDLVNAINDLGERTTREVKEAAEREHPQLTRVAAVLLLAMTDEDLRRLSVDLICDLTCPDWPADPTEFEDLLGSLLDYDSERLKAVRLDEGVSSIRVLAARVIRMVDGDEERSRHTDSFVRRLTGRDLDGWIDWVRVRRRR